MGQDRRSRLAPSSTRSGGRASWRRRPPSAAANDGRAQVDLSSAARKDLTKLLKTPLGPEIKRVVMEELTAEPWPENLDVVSLEGKGTWLRVRVGAFRIVLRPLNAAECTARDAEKGYLVARVLNRRDLEHILKAYR